MGHQTTAAIVHWPTGIRPTSRLGSQPSVANRPVVPPPREALQQRGSETAPAAAAVCVHYTMVPGCRAAAGIAPPA